MPMPMAMPPMLGVPPPPIGLRLPDPRAITDLKAGIAKLLDAAEKDPGLVGKAINPLIRQLIDARTKLLEPPKPPKPPRQEAEDADEGPLDQTPGGDVSTGTPALSALPRLMGLPGMR